MAAEVRRAGTDKKWDELSEILQSKHMTSPDGTKRKIIILGLTGVSVIASRRWSSPGTYRPKPTLENI